MATDWNSLHSGGSLYITVLIILVARTDSQFTEVCGAPGYDLSNLTARIWTFNLTDSPGECLQESNTTGDTCRFFMSFCRNLNSLMLFGCTGASVCQDNIKDQTKSFQIGAYEQNPFKVDTEYNPRGFIVDYPHGGPYRFENGTDCTLSVRLNFVCDIGASWDLPPSPSTHGLVPKPVPVLFNVHTCQYQILMNYAGACFTDTPFEVSVLSVGSILVIIFFATLSAYCLFGTSIKCFKGTRGKEAVPNNVFWAELPVYVSEGVLFLFKGCQPAAVSRATYDDI